MSEIYPFRGWQIHFWSTCPRASGKAKFTCPTSKSTCPTKFFIVIKNKQYTYRTMFLPFNLIFSTFNTLHKIYSFDSKSLPLGFLESVLKNQRITCWYLVGFALKVKNKHFINSFGCFDNFCHLRWMSE